MPAFFILLLLVLFLVNFVIFNFFSTIFALSLKWKVWFAIALGVSFLLALLGEIFSRLHFGMLAEIFSYFNGIYLGLIFSLFLSAIVSYIIIFIAGLFHSNLNLKYFGIFAVVFMLTYMFYGLWNASRPVLKTQEVYITNIPEAWENKKVLFLADVHLGLVWSKNFFQKIVDIVNEEGADIVFISGDLFDGPGPNLDYFKEVAAKFQVPDGVFVVKGNHDIYFGEETFDRIMGNTPITLLDNEFVIVDGVQIVGLNSVAVLNTREKLNEVLLDLEKSGFDREKPSILLLHEPHYINEFIDFGIDLQLSGHTHAGQMWPLNYIAKWANEGNVYGLKRIGDFNIYVTSGIRTWGPPMRIGNRPEIVILEFKGSKNISGQKEKNKYNSFLRYIF